MTILGKTAALAAFGALLLIGTSLGQRASAHEPHPGLQFSIGVQGVAGCNTRASDVTCTLPSGQPFVLEVGLDALPDDIPSYKGFDIYVEFAGVTPQRDASTDVWPDCGFPAAFAGDGFVAWGCATGLPPAGPSSYIGPIGTTTFTCSQSGSLSLRHSYTRGYTDLVQDVFAGDEVGTPAAGTSDAEGNDTRETLTINCGQVAANTPGVVTQGTPGGPGPTPGQAHPEITGGDETPGGTPGATLEPTAAAKATAQKADERTSTAKAKATPGGADPGDDDDGDSKAWVWIVIIVAAVAAVGIAGGGYWYVRNRSSGGTGGAAAT